MTTSSPIQGAIVEVSATDGKALNILPFFAPRRSAGKPTVQREGDQWVLKGDFAGVWDAKGKNIAPKGATEIRKDVRTGRILSIR